MDIIFLSIAGFTIVIKLHPTEWPFFIERGFRGEIFYQHYGFIKRKPSTKIDYTIEVKHAQNLKVLMQTHRKRTYIHFYEETKPSTIVTYYHIGNMQLQLVLRAILQKLLSKKNGMIFHASASLVNGKAYVFLGKSGAGKTTVAQLLATKYQPLADDSIIITKEHGKYWLYQTPFPEKSFWIKKSAERYPLGKFFFLEKAIALNIRKLANKEHISSQFFEQFLTEKDDIEKQIPSMLSLLGTFNHFYRLSFSLHNAQNMVELVGNLP